MATVLDLTKNQEVNLVCSGRPGKPHKPTNLFSTMNQTVIVTKDAIVALGCRACFVDPYGRPSYRGYSRSAVEVASIVETRQVVDDINLSTTEQAEDMEPTFRPASRESDLDRVNKVEPTPTCIPFRGDERQRQDVGSTPDSEEADLPKPKRRRSV